MLVEHAAQVTSVRSLRRGSRVIALSPEAMAALDEAKVDYRCPEDYLPTSVVNDAGRSTYEPVLRFCRSLDRLLAAHDPIVDHLGLQPAQSWHYHFDILAQAVTIRALELRAIVEAERPARVHAFPAVMDRPAADLAFRDESIYARLVPIVARPFGIEVVTAGAPTRPRPAARERIRVAQLIPAHWRQRLVQVRTLGTAGVRVRVDAGASRVLVLNATPDVRALMTADEMQRFHFVHWQGSGDPMTIKPLRLWGDLKVRRPRMQPIVASDAFSGDPDLVSPELWPVIEPRVRHFVAATVAEMVQSAVVTDAVVEQYRPCAAIAGILPDHRAAAAAARLRRLGVPLILYQHGGAYGYLDLPVHYYNDLRLADWFFTYGESVSRELSERHGLQQPCAAMAAVGSAALTHSSAPKPRRSQTGSLPVVLYVATCLMGNRFYAPHNRSCRYYRLLERAIDALESNRGIRIIVKLHSRADSCFNPMAERLAARGSQLEVVTNGPLEPWLDASDLVVVDLPTTSMLEALSRGRRVLAYCDTAVFRLAERARPLLERAVQLETDEHRFIERLRHLDAELRRDLLGRPQESAFLVEYGTTPWAQSRAAEALAAIAADARDETRAVS